MIAEAITQLEAARETLMEKAVQLDVMIDSLRSMENGAATPTPASTPKKQYRKMGDDTVRARAVAELRRQILEVLVNHPSTNAQIARKLHRGESTIAAHTKAMRDVHMLQVIGRKGHSYLYAVPTGDHKSG